VDRPAATILGLDRLVGSVEELLALLRGKVPNAAVWFLRSGHVLCGAGFQISPLHGPAEEMLQTGQLLVGGGGLHLAEPLAVPALNVLLAEPGELRAAEHGKQYGVEDVPAALRPHRSERRLDGWPVVSVYELLNADTFLSNA